MRETSNGHREALSLASAGTQEKKDFRRSWIQSDKKPVRTLPSL
jgi:hypothetical protein